MIVDGLYFTFGRSYRQCCEWHGHIWMQASTSFRRKCASIHLESSDGFMSATPCMVQGNLQTALMLAIQIKNDAMVTVLLDHNANPDIQDEVRQGPQ